MNGTPANSSAESRHRGALIIWGAQVSALVMFFALTWFVGSGAGAGGDDRTFLLVLAAAGLTTLGLSFWLKAKLLAQSAAERRPALATSAYILAFALCESTALFGVLAHFVAGAPEAPYFFAPAALGLALHFPRREHFEDPPPRGATSGEAA